MTKWSYKDIIAPGHTGDVLQLTDVVNATIALYVGDLVFALVEPLEIHKLSNGSYNVWARGRVPEDKDLSALGQSFIKFIHNLFPEEGSISQSQYFYFGAERRSEHSIFFEGRDLKAPIPTHSLSAWKHVITEPLRKHYDLLFSEERDAILEKFRKYVTGQESEWKSIIEGWSSAKSAPAPSTLKYYNLLVPAAFHGDAQFQRAKQALGAVFYVFCFSREVPEEVWRALFIRTSLFLYYYHSAEAIDTLIVRSGLDKHQRMLELLQKPLQGLSTALSTMQSESQELRAILFEPEEALFSSHAAISPFFKDGSPLPLDMPWAKSIQIRHTPSQYALGDAQLVLACLICAIFGEVETVRKLPHRALVIEGTREILGKKRASQATGRLSKDLAWLLAGDENALPEMLLKGATKDKVVNALVNIKDALFTPYKAFSNKWHPRSLQLLVRNETLRGCVCSGELEKQTELQLPDSPISYSTALAFIRDIALALRAPDRKGNPTRKVTSIAARYDAGATVLELIFSRPIEDTREGLDVSFLRKSLYMMAKRAPREWRILTDNFGDTTRPFVFLVNKVLGLDEKDSGFRWMIDTSDSTGTLFSCKKTSDSATVHYHLGVSECRSKICMKWQQT